MTSVTKLLSLLVLAACHEDAVSLTIDPAFTDSEHAAILDARQAWCGAATHWCPEVRPFDGQWQVLREEDWASLHRSPGSLGWTDHQNDTVYVKAEFLNNHEDWAWMIAAHEFGHVQYGTHLKEPNLVMSASHDTTQPPLFTLDPQSIDDVLW